MKSRLDQYLVANALCRSRSQARDAIARGLVLVNGQIARKGGTTVGDSDHIHVEKDALHYVSRAAAKLKAGLDATGFQVYGRTALDIGASTGGFTQVLLEEGAAKVIAIDVGSGQMDAAIAADGRVRLLEGVNARDLSRQHLAGANVQCLVCDVSFISLKLALPPALDLAEPGAWGIFLVKPQFELGRKALNASGIVRESGAARQCGELMAHWLDQQPQWRSTGLFDSPLAGADGNSEFLLAGVKSP